MSKLQVKLDREQDKSSDIEQQDEMHFLFQCPYHTSFGIQVNNEERDLPYIYWITKMHKNPYKHRFIAGSSKCFDQAFINSTYKIAYTN